MRRSVAITVLLCGLLAALPAAADLGDGLPEPGAAPDTTRIYATQHHHVLALPSYLWRALVYPLGQATIYAEHEELPQRTHDLFVNDAGTFAVFPQVQLGGETGTGGGARAFHTDLLGGEESLDALYIFSASERQRAEALFHDPTLGGGGLYWELGGAWMDTDDGDATVNGVVEGRDDLEALIDSVAEGTLLATTTVDLRVALGWRSNAGPLEDYRPGLTLEARAGWARRELRQVTAIPDLATVLRGETSTASASAVPGLGRDLRYAWAGLRLAWDDRDAEPPRRQLSHSLRYQFPGRVLLEDGGLYHSFRNIDYPEGGGLAEATFDVARGDDVEFSRLGVEVQRFRTLFWQARVLALRARLDKVFPAVDGLAPYGDLPTLGGGQRLRGYHRGTFRGEGALLLAAEYRWPVWDTWSASLFWEEGQVFDDFGDLQSDGFSSSGGAALTLRTETAFLLSLRVAHSARVSTLFGFSLEQEF